MAIRYRWPIFAFLFAAALWLQVRLGLTPDVSWLLTVAERVLSGETLYRDILEGNPPFSIWLYMPPAGLAAITGWPSEAWLYGLFTVAFAGSLALSTAILVRGRALAQSRVWYFALAWIALFVVLPLQTFLQREHLGILFLMPWLSLQVVRCGGDGRPPLPAAVIWLCGLSCAVMVLVKPFYALTIVLPVAVLALRKRSIAPLFNPENLIGAVVAAGYALLVVLAYPDFLALYETMKVVYLPVRTPEAMAFFMGCAAVLLGAIVLWKTPRLWPAATVVAVAAAIGHLAGVALMGRAFTYQVLPAFIMLLFGALALTGDQAGTADERRPAQTVRHVLAAFMAAATICVVGLAYLSGEDPDPRLEAYLERHHAGATYISISPSFADSHPLVRLAGGSYVGPQASMRAQAYGGILLKQEPDLSGDQRDQIRASIMRERHLVGEAILDKRPDVLLVSNRLGERSAAAWNTIRDVERNNIKVADLYAAERTIGSVTVYALAQGEIGRH